MSFFNYFKQFINTAKQNKQKQEDEKSKELLKEAKVYRTLVVSKLKSYLPTLHYFHSDDIRYADAVAVTIPYSDIVLLGIQIKNIQFLFTRKELVDNKPEILVLVDASEEYFEYKEVNLVNTSTLESELFVADYLDTYANFSTITP